MIVVDEIQRLPSLLNTIQSLIDDPSNCYRFVLTGSNARKLRRGGANLLPGRIILERLDPFIWIEVQDAFDLQKALQVGMLPGIYLGGAEAVDILGSYAELYLREELHAEALVRNLGDFARLLDIAAIMSGQWLNRALRKEWRLSGYRTESGAEVDLVVERDDDIVGIEIKAGRNVVGADTRGLLSLADTVGGYKPVKKWVAYRGEKEQVFDSGARVLPYLKALDLLQQNA